jgi:hypothetical protein
METQPSFKSDSTVWEKPLENIIFTLHEKTFLVKIGKNIEHNLYYSNIENIRLNYELGGKHKLNKYACIIRLTNRKSYAIKVEDNKKNTVKVQEYKRFVELLIAKIRIEQPNTIMQIGHTVATYRFLQTVLLIVTLIFASVLVYFITDERIRAINVPITLYIIPAIAVIFLIIQFYYLRKHKPYSQSIFESIPNHVFPKS